VWEDLMADPVAKLDVVAGMIMLGEMTVRLQAWFSHWGEF